MYLTNFNSISEKPNYHYHIVSHKYSHNLSIINVIHVIIYPIITEYTLRQPKTAMEHGPFIDIYRLNTMIFHFATLQ